MKQLLNLKSSYYFLKNLVFTLFCIALGFLLGSGMLKARAATVVNIDIAEDLVSDTGYNFSEKIEELEEALKAQNKEYVIILKANSNNVYTDIDVFMYDFIPTLYTFSETQFRIDSNASQKAYRIMQMSTHSLTESSFNSAINSLNNYNYSSSVSVALTLYAYWSSARNIIYSSSFNIANTGSYTYYINTVPYSNGDIIPTYKDIYPSEPKLTLKNSFNSGTNAPLISKIIWNVNPGTDLKTLDGIVNFRIQYGSNDFTSENIPKFLRYKMYGKNTNESEWIEINNHEQIYFDDFVYEYYDSETILNGVLNLPSDMCIYEQIQVEFYFDNTINFYMYVYDDLDDSTWSDVQKYFENYRLYEFPTDKKYAFISHSENIENQGRIYVPYNAIINTDILLNAYIYNFNINDTNLKLISSSFQEETYYNYFDFSFSFNNNEVLMLQRKKSDEKLYFYVSNDYIVQFFDEKENNQILTPNGYVDINSNNIFNSFDDVSSTLNTIDEIYVLMDEFINEAKEGRDYVHEAYEVFWNNTPEAFQIISVFIYVVLLMFASVRIGGFGQNG